MDDPSAALLQSPGLGHHLAQAFATQVRTFGPEMASDHLSHTGSRVRARLEPKPWAPSQGFPPPFWKEDLISGQVRKFLLMRRSQEGEGQRGSRTEPCPT